MKLKNYYRFTLLLLLTVTIYYGCADLEFSDNAKLPIQDFDISSRASLPQALLDSTIKAEKAVNNNDKNPSTSETTASAFSTSVNYALQATVSAQSTYPGYSVQKIKDGSRNTTVGPSYSWANNYPDGTRLPQSVFLKFGSLKKVNRIDIYTSSGYELQNYTIQYRVTPTGTWN
ncbi:MAG: hypothetical protein J0L66_10640 [Cytophagales bacterium]|nr:hypothetical protein [Cytophagales bacterium]